MIRHHVIKRQVFEIAIEREDQFAQVSDLLLYLMNHELKDFIDKTLTQYDISNRKISIDRIEIDLGALDVNDLRQSVINQFKAKFPRLIKGKIDEVLSRQPQLPGIYDRDLQSLTYILLYGTPAWWITRNGPSTRQLITHLILYNRETLHRLWSFGKNVPAFRKRMLTMIDLSDLLQVIYKKKYIRVPWAVEEWQAFVRIILQKLPNLPGSGISQLQVKENLLLALLESSRQQQRPREQYDPFRLVLNMPFESLPVTIRTALAAQNLLPYGYGNRSKKRKELARLEQNRLSSDTLLIPEITDLKVFLESGYIPSSVSSRSYTNVNTLFRYLLENYLDDVALLIKILGRNNAVRTRFLDRISEANVRLFFSYIAPEKVALFEWITEAYFAVQETYKPINQTNIRVQRSINEITLELYVQNNLNNLSSEAFMRLHFQRMALKYNIRYGQLLDMVLQAIKKRKKKKLYKSNFNVVLEKLYQKHSASPSAKTKLSRVSVKETLDNWKQQSPKHIVIPASVARELQTLRKTQLLGKHNVLLHTFLEEQLKWRKLAKETPDEAFSNLLEQLARQLHVDPDFLKRVLVLKDLITSTSSKRVSGRLSEWIRKHAPSLLPTSSPNILIEHLAANRQSYQPKQLKVLLEPYLKTDTVSRPSFEKLLGIIFSTDAKSILKAFDVWIMANSRVLKGNMEAKLQLRFIRLALQYAEPRNQLARIFQSVQEILPKSMQTSLLIPELVRTVFKASTPSTDESTLRRKRQTPLAQREKQLLTFYDILQLDSELADIVNDSFYNNILFSFELLRGKYKELFLEILRRHSIRKEFIEYLSDEPNQPFLRLLLNMLPVDVTRNMQKMSRTIDQLFSLIPLIALSKQQLHTFILKHTLRWYFVSAEELPSTYELFLHLLRQAQQENLLHRSFTSGNITTEAMDWSALIRSISAQKADQLRAGLSKDATLYSRLIADTKGWSMDSLRMLRANTSSSSQDAVIELIEYVLRFSIFPEAHAFFGESISANTRYFRELLLKHPEIIKQVYLESRPPRQRELLMSWLDESLAITLLSTVFGDSFSTVEARVRDWTTIAVDFSAEFTAIESVRILLYYPKRIYKNISILIGLTFLKTERIHPWQVLLKATQEGNDVQKELVKQLPAPARIWQESDVVKMIAPRWFDLDAGKLDSWIQLLRKYGKHLSPVTKIRAVMSAVSVIAPQRSGGDVAPLIDVIRQLKGIAPEHLEALEKSVSSNSGSSILLPEDFVDVLAQHPIDYVEAEELFLQKLFNNEVLTPATISVMLEVGQVDKIVKILQQRYPAFPWVTIYQSWLTVLGGSVATSSRNLLRIMISKSIWEERPTKIHALLFLAIIDERNLKPREVINMLVEMRSNGIPETLIMDHTVTAYFIQQKQAMQELLIWLHEIDGLLLEAWLRHLEEVAPDTKILQQTEMAAIAKPTATSESASALDLATRALQQKELSREPDSTEARDMDPQSDSAKNQQQETDKNDIKRTHSLADPALAADGSGQQQAELAADLALAADTSKQQQAELAADLALAADVSKQQQAELAADLALAADASKQQQAELTAYQQLEEAVREKRMDSGPASILPEIIRLWLRTGTTLSGNEEQIKLFVEAIPLMAILSQSTIHQNIFHKLSDWISNDTVSDLIENLLPKAIRDQEQLHLYSRLLTGFILKADKKQLATFLEMIYIVAKRHTKWNKPVFWETLMQKTMILPAMEAVMDLEIPPLIHRMTIPSFMKEIVHWYHKKHKFQGDSIALLEKYLKSSTLSAVINWESPEMQAIRNLWQQQAQLLSPMIHLYAAESESRRRIVQLMNEFGEKELLASIHPQLMEQWNVLEKLLAEKASISIRSLLGLREESALWDLLLFIWSAQGLTIVSPVELLKEVMVLLFPKLEEKQVEDIRQISRENLNYTEAKLWKQLSSLLPGLRDEKLKPKKQWKIKEETKIDIPDEEAAEAGITIYNAGLVLLWPFLGRFFRMLQLADEKAFRDEQALERAIQLTQYLVNFKTEIDEQELSLNKLLCGAEFKFPVSPVLEPTPEESSLAMKMLRGALQNWESMKNTRPETFQETFLQREGRLYRLDNRWELVVEKKAYDMLLDSLPWNISMIKMSWMKDRLVVIWR